MRLFRITLLILVTLCTGNVMLYGQWTEVFEKHPDKRSQQKRVFPTRYKTYKTDLEAILHSLPKTNTESTLSLPFPDGTVQQFVVKRKDVFHPDLAAQYPTISSYTGRHLDDASQLLKLSVSPKGIDAMITSPSGAIFVDRLYKNDAVYYVSYRKQEYTSTSQFRCESHSHDNGIIKKKVSYRYGDCIARTYRLALACTGEYAAYHGGTKESVLAEFNTAINRVNGVYERELGISFQLIPETDTLIFLNGSIDPYNNDDGKAMMSQNQAVIDQLITPENYDIGHVLSTRKGGIASLRSACTHNRKARGVTGLEKPEADPFYIDYICHEIGHQFGATHTFNNQCEGNIHEETAFEPGSGSTIMGYAGVCEPNILNNSQAYFHSVSLEQMHDYIIAGSGGCAVQNPSNNSAPTINEVDDSFVIPHSTPFVLTARSTDQDASDVLTYTWEQMDQDTMPMPPQDTSSLGPLFRSVLPSTDTFRMFPQLSSILDGSNKNEWEVLPAVGRELHFRVTVRDNAQHGCTDHEDIAIMIDGDAGPFEVMTPEPWIIGQLHTITWDVANTDQAPVNCKHVDLLLSIDGGETFSVSLGENVPNNGKYAVTIPEYVTTAARIMIKSSNSIFFDVNNEDFKIEKPTLLRFLSDITTPLCYGQNNGSIVVNVSSGTPPYRYSIDGSTPQSSKVFDQLSAGKYTITVVDSLDQSSTQSITLTQPDSLSVSVDTVGKNATIKVMGGSLPYSYTLSNGRTQSFPTFSDLLVGEYTVKVSDRNDCSIEKTFTIDSTVSTQDVWLDRIKIYPNPFEETLTISKEEDILLKRIQFLDTNGKIILDKKYSENVDVSHLNNGVYVLKLWSEDSVGSKLLVKL